MKKKIISIFTLIAFFVSISANLALADFNFSVPGDMISLQLNGGKVIDSYKGKDSNKIFIIEDVHSDPYVEKNIYEIIKQLKEKEGDSLNLIGVEGAFTEVRFDFLAKFPNKKIKDEVSRRFFDRGDLTAAELFSIQYPGQVRVMGIEDKDIYMANFKDLYLALAYREEFNLLYDNMKKGIESIKRYMYPDRLKEFEQELKELKNTRSRFRYLENIAGKLGIDISSDCPNITRLLELIELERSLDFEAIFTETKYIIDTIRELFSDEEFRNLEAELAKNRIDNLYLYVYLKDLIDGKYLDISDMCKNLSLYFKYLDIANDLNEPELVNEKIYLEYIIRKKMIENREDGLKVFYLDYYLDLLRGFLNNSLSHKYVEEWRKNKSEFYELFKELDAKIFVNPVFEKNKDFIVDYEKIMDSFYGYANRRNEILLENMLLYRDKIRESRHNENSSIMIIGGYHADDIINILRDKGISYDLIMPDITDFDSKSLYFDKIDEQGNALFSDSAQFERKRIDDRKGSLKYALKVISAANQKRLSAAMFNELEKAAQDAKIDRDIKPFLDKYRKQVDLSQLVKKKKEEEEEEGVMVSVPYEEEEIEETLKFLIKGVNEQMVKKRVGLSFIGIQDESDEREEKLQFLRDAVQLIQQLGDNFDDIDISEGLRAVMARINTDNNSELTGTLAEDLQREFLKVMKKSENQNLKGMLKEINNPKKRRKLISSVTLKKKIPQKELVKAAKKNDRGFLSPKMLESENFVSEFLILFTPNLYLGLNNRGQEEIRENIEMKIKHTIDMRKDFSKNLNQWKDKDFQLLLIQILVNIHEELDSYFVEGKKDEKQLKKRLIADMRKFLPGKAESLFQPAIIKMLSSYFMSKYQVAFIFGQAPVSSVREAFAFNGGEKLYSDIVKNWFGANSETLINSNMKRQLLVIAQIARTGFEDKELNTSSIYVCLKLDGDEGFLIRTLKDVVLKKTPKFESIRVFAEDSYEAVELIYRQLDGMGISDGEIIAIRDSEDSYIFRSSEDDRNEKEFVKLTDGGNFGTKIITGQMMAGRIFTATKGIFNETVEMLEPSGTDVIFVKELTQEDDKNELNLPVSKIKDVARPLLEVKDGEIVYNDIMTDYLDIIVKIAVSKGFSKQEVIKFVADIVKKHEQREQELMKEGMSFEDAHKQTVEELGERAEALINLRESMFWLMQGVSFQDSTVGAKLLKEAAKYLNILLNVDSISAEDVAAHVKDAKFFTDRIKVFGKEYIISLKNVNKNNIKGLIAFLETKLEPGARMRFIHDMEVDEYIANILIKFKDMALRNSADVEWAASQDILWNKLFTKRNKYMIRLAENGVLKFTGLRSNGWLYSCLSKDLSPKIIENIAAYRLGEDFRHMTEVVNEQDVYYYFTSIMDKIVKNQKLEQSEKDAVRELVFYEGETEQRIRYKSYKGDEISEEITRINDNGEIKKVKASVIEAETYQNFVDVYKSDITIGEDGFKGKVDTKPVDRLFGKGGPMFDEVELSTYVSFYTNMVKAVRKLYKVTEDSIAPDTPAAKAIDMLFGLEPLVKDTIAKSGIKEESKKVALWRKMGAAA